ncbi:hypothetical protein AB6A23_04895 [Paenibacillus tarimensis]
MPDWSYQTLFRPLLFGLPSRLARTLTLTAMGSLSRVPGGAFVIRTLGHMEPSPLLMRSIAGLALGTPIGLSGGVDPQGTAHKALAQFGFGFIEHGPVTVRPIRCQLPIGNDRVRETIRYPSYYENEGLDRVAERMLSPGHRLPQMARLTPMPDASPERALQEIGTMMKRLRASGAAGFYLDIVRRPRSWEDSLSILEGLPAVIESLTENGDGQIPLFIYFPPELPKERLVELLNRHEASMWSGCVIGEAVQDGAGVRVGREGKALAIRLIEQIRALRGPAFVIKAGGGVHEPRDALDLMSAGADNIILHSGLIYAGPGLPKRINEAIIYEQVRTTAEPEPPLFWKHWGWMCLLGIGMIIGGMIAWFIAATTVLLHYDLEFLGMTLSEIHSINGRLLHFMSHDRITLAGTMISIGILYFQLARYGLKYGLHWAKTALMTSGIVGFSSFFLYLGYGYFDPLHALVAAILLPMFILSMRSNPDQPDRRPVNLHNSGIWRQAMWGQLCFVSLGFALATGGLTIAAVGVTQVFVPEDLVFLQTTPAQLQEANPHLIPLIAHDRAGFGGALLCDALAILILALWGIQQGRRWQWWTLLLGGAPGFYAGFSIHLHIGYTDLWHLMPALFALLLYITGLILLYPYLMRKAEG